MATKDKEELMESSYRNLEIIMREFNEKPFHIAQIIGVSPSLFSDWKHKRSMPKTDKLKMVADYFGIPVEAFLCSVDDLPNIVNSRNKKNKNQADPLFDVAAGDGCYNGQYTDKIMTALSEEDCSWCEVHGDSMYPILMDGDKVLVHHQTETSPHDLTVVKIDGDQATVKFVEIANDGVWLRAENKSVFEDKFFTIQEVLTLPVSIIGKVIELRRSF